MNRVPRSDYVRYRSDNCPNYNENQEYEQRRDFNYYNRWNNNYQQPHTYGQTNDNGIFFGARFRNYPPRMTNNNYNRRY